jgi:hypothetical protein
MIGELKINGKDKLINDSGIIVYLYGKMKMYPCLTAYTEINFK